MSLPERPGSERDEAILQAVKEGRFEQRWSKLRIGSLELEVGTDALRVDGFRVPVSARLQQWIADELDCVLPTVRISDAIWEQAVNRLKVRTQTPDAQMAFTSRARRHSDGLDQELAGRPGLATAGKDWVLDPVLWQRPGRAANYGWRSPAGHLTQPLQTGHNLDHTDYSQFCRLVRRKASLNGEPVDLAEVYTDLGLHKLLSLARMVDYRHPGVPMRVGHKSGPLPWLDPKLTLGERAVAFSRHEMHSNVQEEPPGSNAGARIREYFRPALRDGKPLGITSGNWCAVAACYAMQQSLVHGDVTPHGYRVSGLELERDAKVSSRWRSIELARTGSRLPEQGDLLILQRGAAGSWTRHVCRVVERDGTGCSTIGGNEDNRWRITQRLWNDLAILGWIVYPYREALPPVISSAQPLLASFAAELDSAEKFA